MGTQFKWFLDAFAGVLLLITAFVAGKKGFSKTLILLIGFIVSVVLGFTIGASVSNVVYTNTIKPSNIKKVNSSMQEGDFIDSTIAIIESSGYSVRINKTRLSEKLLEDGDMLDNLYNYLRSLNGVAVDTPEGFTAKMQHGYAEMMRPIFSEASNDYTADHACASIEDKFSEFAPVLYKMIDQSTYDTDERSYMECAKRLEALYMREPYKEMISLVGFCIVAVISVLITILIALKMTPSGNFDGTGFAEHFFGFLSGLIEGLMLLFIVAAIVRTLTIFGTDDMMIFNEVTIEKTKFFKHIYNITQIL